MEIKSTVSKYIVQPGDTVESISAKFGISERIFYRYNKIMKYIPLTPNSPVLIASFSQEEIINMKIDNNEVNPTLNMIACYLREGYVSSIYLEENVDIVKNELDRYYQQLLNELVNPPIQNKEGILEILNELTAKAFDLVPILKKKDSSMIKNYEQEMSKEFDKLYDLMLKERSGINKELLKDTLVKINKENQLMAIKLLTGEYQEAQNAFDKILVLFKTLNKNILTH